MRQPWLAPTWPNLRVQVFKIKPEVETHRFWSATDLSQQDTLFPVGHSY